MIILLVKTDVQEAEIWLYDNAILVAHDAWVAHRELSITLTAKIDSLLHDNERTKSDVQGIGIFKGPGSFTGLRIGVSVANAMAYALSVPIVGASGNSWQKDAVDSLLRGASEQIVLPEYGGVANITQPKK